MSNGDLIGKGWQFPPRFNKPNAGPALVFDEELVDQSMYVILNTLLGEHVMDSSFGSRLNDYSFGAVNETLLADIRIATVLALKLNEPRIIVDDLTFNTSQIYDGMLSIEILYQVINSNNIRNMVFPMYVQNA